tara:strand:- start:67 stop:213 length:147 start_codon:yes stop_codon:yes gene_type:complete
MKIYTAKDSLIEFQKHRINALEEHAEFLEEECIALYDQLDDARRKHEI